MIPETKGVLLEEIDTLFGGANHVENGGKIMGVEDAHHAHGGEVEKGMGSERIEEIRHN